MHAHTAQYARSDTVKTLSTTFNGGTINTYGSDSVGVAARTSPVLQARNTVLIMRMAAQSTRTVMNLMVFGSTKKPPAQQQLKSVVAPSPHKIYVRTVFWLKVM